MGAQLQRGIRIFISARFRAGGTSVGVAGRVSLLINVSSEERGNSSAARSGRAAAPACTGAAGGANVLKVTSRRAEAGRAAGRSRRRSLAGGFLPGPAAASTEPMITARLGSATAVPLRHRRAISAFCLRFNTVSDRLEKLRKVQTRYSRRQAVRSK